MSQQCVTIKEKSITVECINRCAVHLTGQITFLQEVDESSSVWYQSEDSPEENYKILEHVKSYRWV